MQKPGGLGGIISGDPPLGPSVSQAPGPKTGLTSQGLSQWITVKIPTFAVIVQVVPRTLAFGLLGPYSELRLLVPCLKF